jgi:SWI/SNF-related matrix-associated actin-dependent regulator of chromatin subfamily A3
MDNLPKFRINFISNAIIKNTLNNNRDYLLENDNYLDNYLENLPEAPQPEALITNLLPYQKQGLGWMISNENPEMPTTNKAVQFWIQREDQNKDRYYYNIMTKLAVKDRPNFFRGGILADDMGLGKTIQMIALIANNKKDGKGFISTKSAISLDQEYSKTTLIVSPLSVLGNWIDQIKMHVKKDSFSCYVFHGPNRNDNPIFLKNHDIVITTYGMIGDAKSKLFAIKWLRVILDEGHIIRTKSTKQSIAACDLDAERRWILTGTPIMNELNDMYSLVKFLRFTPFGELELWNRIFNKPEDDNNLRRLMKIICLRRTKDMKINVRPILSLPPINFYVHKIKFKADERNLYYKMEKETKDCFKKWREGLDNNCNSTIILEKLLRLRQICNHKNLCKIEGQEIEGQDTKTSSKIEALLEILNKDQNNVNKSVVFSQWTSFLDLVALAFKEANIQFVRFDGNMLRNQRDKAINDFSNDPKIKVFLASLKCGSLGLNLTAANQCFLMDPWWNPSIEEQAVDRIYRIGQS